MIATIADARATASVKAANAKVGDAFDMEIGGRADESAGDPIRIQGTISAGHGVTQVAQEWPAPLTSSCTRARRLIIDANRRSAFTYGE